MRLSFPIIIFLVFLIDQISKWWVVECLIRPVITPERYDASATPFLVWLTGTQNQLPFASIEVLPFFNIVMVWNKGISFGIFNDPSLHGPMMLTALSTAIAAMFAVWLWRTRDAVVALSLSLIIGGAIGNVLDRLRFGAVVDFLDVHAFGWHWPAFNVADSAITVGIAILLIHSLFFDRKSKEAVPT